jgi:hypothetical protein
MIGRDQLPLPSPTRAVAADLSPQPATRPPATQRLALVPEQQRARGHIRRTFRRLRATLDAGESLWTPVLVYLSGWVLVLPAFLFMIGVSFAAYYLAGGE